MTKHDILRIAFIANTSWNIYNFRKGLVQHFLGRGEEVYVLTPKDEYTETIQAWGVCWFETPIDGTGANPLKDLSYFLKIQGIIRRIRPDVMLGYTIKSNIYGCLVAKFNKVPIICNVSGLGTVFLVSGLAGKAALLLYRIAFRYANVIFFQNADDKELFLSKVNLAYSKVDLVPGSGINISEFAFQEVEPSEPVKILMISRLIVEKGVHEFAKAAEYFKDDTRVSFTLVGKLDTAHARAIEEEELNQWIAKGWITYLPHSDKIKELIKDHEVIALPSYREGTPRTLLEGAAMGRTLLATDVPGCREVVEDGYNGFLFQLKKEAQLISKIKLYLALDRDQKRELSKNSRALVEERFDENIVIQKYEDAIHRITSDN